MDVARAGEDGGDRIFVLFVDRRDKRIEIAFAHPCNSKEKGADHLLGQQGFEARLDLRGPHGFQFMRRPGQEHDDRAVARKLEPLSGGGSAIVGQHSCTIDHVGLAFVDFHHFAVEALEALFEPIADFLREDEFAPEGGGGGVARDVVFCGAESTCEDDELRAQQTGLDLIGKAFAAIANHALLDDFDAKIVELGGEKERIGVELFGSKKFASDSDDFRVWHVVLYDCRAFWLGAKAKGRNNSWHNGFSTPMDLRRILLAAVICWAGATHAHAQSCTFSISPDSQEFAASGGTGLVTINATPAGCTTARTASSAASWITINFGGTGNGAGSVSYTVAANTGPNTRTGTMTVAGRTFTVTQQGTPCTFSISPSSQSFTSDGGTGAVTIGAAPSGCQSARTATATASWITLSSGASGNGEGTLVYSVSANSGSSSRTGTITVAGRAFTVTQDALACNYTINPSQANFPASGGSDQITITASPVGCSTTRTAISSNNFITISFGAAGSGSGTVGYTVAANNFTVERTGSMTIAGRTFTVTQAAGSCAFTLSPASATIPTAGGSGGFNVTPSNQSCSWTAVNNAPDLIQFTSGDSGSGNGRIEYTVGQNALTISRTGSITVGTSTHNVTQSAGCRVTATPTGTTIAAGGGTATFQITTTGSGCSWTATPNQDYITINSGGSGSANGTVSYSVAANTTGMDRVGSISVNDFGFTIFQSSNCAYVLSSTLTSLPAVGGAGSFSVTTTCPWTAIPSADWIVLNTTSGTGNGSIGFTIAGNTSAQPRSGTITLGSSVYRINQEGVACSVSINPAAVNAPASGETYPVTVDAPVGCKWGASSTAAFVSIATGDEGGFRFTVSANPSPTVRRAVITVADKTLSIAQDAAVCDYTLTPRSAAFGSTGGAGSFTIGTTCAWTALTQASWIVIPQASLQGSGDGTVNFKVARLTGGEGRTGSIRVGSATFTVTQTTSPCAINLSQQDVEISGAGGRAVVRVFGSPTCRWSPAQDSDWLNITSWSSVNGTGVVNLSAPENPNLEPREARLLVSATGAETQTVKVTQGGLTPSVQSVINAASLVDNGTIAPGTLVRVRGASMGPAEIVLGDKAGDTLASDLAGVQLLFNGIPAPLVSVWKDVIEAVVPFGLAGASSAEVVVRNNGVDSRVFLVDVAAAVPGVFTADASGRGQAQSANQNGSVNAAANAAARNETVTFLITGAGQLRPDGVDGRIYRQANALPVPLQAVTAQIGGQAAAVTAAAVVQGETGAIVRVTARIAQNATTGASVPVAIRVGPVAVTQAGVTIAVR